MVLWCSGIVVLNNLVWQKSLIILIIPPPEKSFKLDFREALMVLVTIQKLLGVICAWQ